MIKKIQELRNVTVEILDPRNYASIVAEEIVSLANLLLEDLDLRLCDRTDNSPGQSEISVHEEGDCSSSNKGKIRVCLSGGKTPLVVYKLLASQPLVSQFPWDRTVFFVGDERWTDDVEMKNSVSILNHLKSNSPSQKYLNFISWEGESLGVAAENFLENLRKHGVCEAGFDILLLGVGEDGHIASLFPSIDFDNEIVSIIREHPNTVYPRLSIGPQLILKSKRVLVLIKGENKQDIVRRLFNENNNEIDLPAEMLFRCSGRVQFFIDAVAGKHIR